jgi:very-short-patch-repair endonuclease
MLMGMTSHDFDRAMEALARTQHGVFADRQAKARGGTARMIRYRVATGRWFELDDGVFALPGNPGTWLRQAKAAELSVRGSALSGRSAAALHGFTGFAKGAIELTAPRGARRSSRLAMVRHRDGVPTTVVSGIRVTTVEQTIIDLAGSSPVRLAAAIDDLLVGRRMQVHDLERAARRARLARLPGSKLLGLLAAERSPTAWVPPTNVLERALYAVLDDPVLPAYRRQVPFEWDFGRPNTVDAVIDDWRRVVEADGRRWHARWADFERDRERDHRAQKSGYEVTRFTYDQLVRTPATRARCCSRSAGSWRHEPMRGIHQMRCRRPYARRAWVGPGRGVAHKRGGSSTRRPQDNPREICG